MIESINNLYQKFIYAFGSLYTPDGYVFSNVESSDRGYEIFHGSYSFPIYNVSVVPEGNATLLGYETLYVGKTTLTNNLNIDQVMKTESFSKAVSNTTSNTTTNGVSIGAKVSASFSVMVAGSGVQTAVEVSSQYDFSSSSTNSHTETITLTISKGALPVVTRQ